MEKKVRGFSLTELLIAMVILSVLVMLALPRLQPLVTRAKSKEAQLALSTLKTLQDAFFLEYDRYSSDFRELGFEHPLTIDQGGEAKYQVRITDVSAGGWEASATALVDFDGDGELNVWIAGNKRPVTELVGD